MKDRMSGEGCGKESFVRGKKAGAQVTIKAFFM
jgi:hypothetical protein